MWEGGVGVRVRGGRMLSGSGGVVRGCE